MTNEAKPLEVVKPRSLVGRKTLDVAPESFGRDINGGDMQLQWTRRVSRSRFFQRAEMLMKGEVSQVCDSVCARLIDSASHGQCKTHAFPCCVCLSKVDLKAAGRQRK